jgi:hypothetical protein
MATTSQSDSELYQQVTDICAENGGVTKSMVDKLVALFDHRAEKLVVEARQSQTDHLFAVLRHLGYRIDKKAVIKLSREWKEQNKALTATKDDKQPNGSEKL